MTTPTKKPRIKFPAAAHHQIGTVLRHFALGFKFWKVYKVEGGEAFAKPTTEPAGGVY